jgi:hypothetical protein
LDNKAHKPLPAHNEEISVLYSHKSYLYSGCKGGKVILWGFGGYLQLRANILNFTGLVKEPLSVNSISVGSADDLIIVSTDCGKVYVKDKAGKNF